LQLDRIERPPALHSPPAASQGSKIRYAISPANNRLAVDCARPVAGSFG
jgi:hypothetical protein